MLRSRRPAAQAATFTIDGATVTAAAGETLAVAMMRLGPQDLRRTAISGQPRAPYCLMGVCFECLVEIDGIPNQQACLVKVRPGLVVRRQDGAPDLMAAS